MELLARPLDLPCGATLPNLYKYDINSAAFIDTGIKAEMSEDGMFFVTPEGAITETSIYFVAVPQTTTTLAGRVVESNGQTPVRGAIVSARGRSTVTDGNGGFSLQQVPTGNEEEDSAPPASGVLSRAKRARAQTTGIQVTTSYLRPSGRTDSVVMTIQDPVVGGITDVPTVRAA